MSKVDIIFFVYIILFFCICPAVICYEPRKKDEEDDNLSNCYHCNKPVCFERHTQKLPEEYEVCRGCDDHVCNDCVDWQFMDKHDLEDPVCKKCVESGWFPE